MTPGKTPNYVRFLPEHLDFLAESIHEAVGFLAREAA